jgi:hypothetical protein
MLIGLFVPLVAAQGYCAAGPTATTDSNLGAMTFGGGNEVTYTPPCPGVVGLDDQTSKTLYLAPGVTYTTSSVTFSSCGANYPNAGTIWIDLNQNQQFDADEAMGTWSGTPPSTQQITLTIPSSAPKGTTRMRVMQRESGSLPLAPCAQYTWGACVDFTVVIGSGGPGSGDGGIGGGTVFLIILIVVIPVYIIAGCVYMRKQKGTTTMAESCPHSEFWFAFPGLIKDGCMFTAAKIKQAAGRVSNKGTADGYDEV